MMADNKGHQLVALVTCYMIYVSTLGGDTWKSSGEAVHLYLNCSYWSLKYKLQNTCLVHLLSDLPTYMQEHTLCSERHHLA